MTIEEIIKRQKEHLTKAQIGELIQATERYKQLNAANRASAMRTLSDQYRATRRGFQNTGLAGRKGKLVSGQEKAARIRANEAYRSYNAGLRQIDNAYAQNRAARMANETARENQLAEIEKIQEENDKEAARINAEYEAWLRKKKAAEDEYKRRQKEIERLRVQQQAQQQQIRERIEEDRTEQSGVVQGNRIQRIAKDKHPQLETSDYARAAQEQAVQRAVNEYQQTQKVFRQQREADATYDALHPGSAITRAPHTDDYIIEQKRVENARQLKGSGASDAEVWFADAYGVSAGRYKTVKNENPELIKELTGAIQDLRTKNYDTVINTPGNIYDKHKAREDKAKAESAISKAAVAMGIDDAETRKLYLMNDTQFAVSRAAAAAMLAAAQTNERSTRGDTYRYAESDYYNGIPTSANPAAQEEVKRATERLAMFDHVQRLRTDTAEKSLYYDSYQTDVQTKDAKTVRSFCAINQNTSPYAWANPKNENGENWYQAAQNGWKAENDGNTKYGALVNDWSLVGGRQGMRYQQTGKVAALLANVMPHFYDLADETGTYSNAFEDTHVKSWAVHNGISTADYYDYVRNSCVKAFYGNNASHEDYEQMDAMLALANLMTDEERARFNELANGSYGAFANEADEYFEYLYKNVLPERFKAYVDELNGVFTDTTYGKIGQSALSVLTNLGEGITGPIHTLTTNYNDSVSAQLGAMKYTTAQAARESVSKDFSPVGKFFYDTGMSMADSASVAMISGGIGKALQGAGVGVKLATKAGSVLGGSILGGSAFNSAYKEALDRGLAPDKARTIAVGQGFNEMLFESLSLDLLVGQFQKGGILKVSKNGFVNWAVNTLVQGGVEGSEEVFTDIANRLWDNTVNGIYSEELTKLREYIGNGMSYEDAKRKVEAEYAEQLGMSFLGGFVSGGVMGGGASFMGMLQNHGNEKFGKGLRQNSRAMNMLRNFDYKSEYAQEILTQDKLTNQDVADLFNIMQQELLGRYKSDIQKAVADGKITQEQADILKQYEQNGVQIVKDGKVIGNAEGITVEQMPSVHDAIAKLDNAAKIQFLNNEEMRSLVKAVGGETAAVIEQSETEEREAEKKYRQTVREINNDTTLSPEQKQERLEAAERTRQNARSEASKIADAALTNKKGIGAKLETDGNGTVKVGKGSGKVTYDFSTKDNPGHQTVDSMTATEQSALRIAKIVAASRGDVNVKVEAEFGVDENGIDHSKENGYYDPNTKTIHINMSGDNSVLWTLSHELTHHLANTDTEAYAALRTAIETALKDSKLTTTELEDRGFEYDLDRVDPYIAREGNLWDALVAFEREEHGYGKDAEEEVVARCCESFLGFDQFVKDFARKQYKSAKAINKFIAQMNIDMQRVSEDARQIAAQRNVWNDESPENQILRQLTEIDRIANLWRIAVNAEAKKRQESKRTARENTVEQTNGNRYSKVDSVLAKRLDSEEMVTVYRAMQVIDGKLYPPMAAKVADERGGKGKLVEPTEIDQWYKSDERPDLIDPKTGRWKLDKANGSAIAAAYNPYFHTSTSPLNDQFSSAYKRDNLVVVEGYVPKSELTSGYKAQYAKDSVGAMRWHSGTVSAKLKTPRTVILSRYFKASRILTDAEVASKIKTMLEGEDVSIPQQLVTPGLYKALNDAGVKTTPMDGVRASTKDSVKRSDAEYLDLARRYESGDKSVEADLRKAVDDAAKRAFPNSVLIQDGKFRKMWHHTNKTFNSFLPGTSTSGGGLKGIFFTPQESSTMSRLGDVHKAYYLNVENMKFAFGVEADRKYVNKLREMQNGATDRNELARINREFKEETGVDAFFDWQNGWYNVMTPEQIKSADLITKDDNGNIIPLSERFNTKNDDIRYSKADKVKLSSGDSPVVNRIADESFPIQPKTNRAEAKYEKTVAHDTKVRLADIQDSMFHPVMRSIKDAVPISDRTLAKARSLKEIPYNISMYENTEKAIVDLAKFIKENYSGKYDVQGNLLLPEETVQSNNIFSNASYLKDAEPTTECYRQTIYRAFLKVVTDQLGRPVTEREAIIVNQACIEIGLDAPCIYCYSLLDRKAKEGYKLQYLAERDAFLAKIDEEYHGDIEAFKRDRAKNFDRYNELYLSRVTDPAAYKDGVYDKSMARKGNAAKVDRVKLWLDVYESGYHDGTMITANDVRNIEAEEASLKEAKGNSLRTRELKDILYWSQSASQAKKIIPYSAYTNDGRRSILSWSQNTIDALNREYGLRWYSHADFHPAFIVDNMQQIMDASVKGLKGLMYVKPVEAAKIFAPTGMLINVSCFAQYKNGQYVADDRMGADWTEVQNLRKQYENVGAVMVVTTDDMWMWAMTQDWVDVIIPLHLVRSGSEFVDTFGLHNYSEEQADKLVGKAAKEKYEAFIADLAAQQEKALSDKDVNAMKKANKSIYPGEHENDYAKYMEACEKRGLTPRFDRMRQLIEEGGMSWGGKEITLQDYMKCVSETRMPYTKAQTLKPSFDFDAAKQTAATLPEKGFFNYFKQSSEWNGKTMTMQDWVNQAVADINAKKDPSKLGYGRDLAVDESGKYLEIGTRAEAKRRGVGGIHDTRSSKVDDVKLTDITEYEHFNEEKYAKMSETERIEYREHIAEMQIRKEARERQIAIDRNRRIRRDLTAMLKRGNDRIVKMLANPTENSHVPVHLAQAVAEYAQRLNQILTTSEPKTGEFAGMEKQTKKGALNAQKIVDALNRSYADKETIDALKAEDPSFNPRGLLAQYDEKGNIFKDETLIKMINGMDSIIQGKHLSDLTEDELRFVLNTMRGVIHTVTEANKVTVDGESRNVYRTSRKMADEVNSATKVFGDKSNKITKFMNRYVIESLSLPRIAKLYSGSDENAVFVKMVDDLNAGALEQERIKQTLRGMFNEVTSKYAKEMDTWYGKNAEWIDTGFGFKITKGMRVSLAMHILNAQNLRNIEKAGLRIPDMEAYRKGNIKEAYKNGKVFRLTKAQAEQIVANMTEAEKAYYEVAKEFFHKRSGFYINRTSLKLLGYSKAIVENYFPIQTDDAYRTVKYDDVRQNASVEHPGFLESRKGTANVMYLNDITAVVNRQIDGVAKYAGLATPMRNWNNIMNAWLFEENEDGEWVRSDDGRAHDVLERRMGYTGKGKAIIDYVDQFITDLTSPVVRDANENVHAAEFAAKITSNYVKAVLTLNARVALSQLASVPTAAAEIPWKYIVQSFGGNVEQHLNRNASNELIDQYTSIFAMRRAGTQTEVSEVMKRRGFADKAEQKLPGLLGWITAMDVAATRRLWYACERWVKGETDIPVGSDAFYKEVARRYNRVIQNTQPNFTVLQRSPALRSKSAAARIITMFGTQRMQNAGVFIESLAEVVQTKDKVKRKAAMKKFGRTLSGLITAAIVIGLERALVSALRGRMRPLQDDDKDITVGSVSKYIMGEIGTSLAGSFMYVGELYDFVHGVVGGLADGDSGYETSFALPAAEALSTVIEFFKNKDWQYFEYMRGDHTDHEKWLKTRSFVNELMTVASYATGLPLANASKTILNGAVPLVQDIVESTKTGELNLYLHQSGKLDSAKTAANYKEWTNLGKKGSVYLAWENRFKEDTSNGLDHRAELLFEDSALTADEKAILLRMSNSTKDNPLTSKDGVVYKEDGTVAVDFTNLDRYRASTMLSDKQYEGFLNLVDMGVAEDIASTAFIQYNVQKKQGSGANDRFRDWLFSIVKNPEDRAKVDMAVIGNTVRVEGAIGYKENGEVYADYSSKEMFYLYTSGKKQEKSDAIISTTDTPEAKAKAFADTDNDYHAKGGIVYNDKDKVVADFTSDEAYRASQMGESHYGKYTEAVKQGMTKENAILAVEKHKEFTNDDDKDNATQYATWVFNTYKSAKDRAIAGAIYTTKPVTIKDGRTYDENGYIYRDYTSAAWYKLSNRTLSSDGTNKRYEAAKKLVDTGLTAERIVEIYEGTTGLSKKSEWKEYLKSLKLTNEQIDIFMKSRWK